jgi:GTP:adenosylcobinamide-phosphate guanylyltransferase
MSEISGEPYEALIPIADRPMICYVLDALRQVPCIERIVVVGPRELQPLLGRTIELVPSTDSLVDNIQAGLAHLVSPQPVLLITSDIPLITGEAIEDFLTRCRQVEAHIYYPIVSKEINELHYPGVQRTYVTLKDGTFTGGNMVLLQPELLTQCQEVISRAIGMRKKPVQLSRMLGLRFIIRYLLKRLEMAEIEDRAGEILGFAGKGIVSPYPEVGIDVDKPSDYELVQECLHRLNADDGLQSNPT